MAAEQGGGGSSGLLGWVIVTWWGSAWWEGWRQFSLQTYRMGDRADPTERAGRHPFREGFSVPVHQEHVSGDRGKK